MAHDEEKLLSLDFDTVDLAPELVDKILHAYRKFPKRIEDAVGNLSNAAIEISNKIGACPETRALNKAFIEMLGEVVDLADAGQNLHRVARHQGELLASVDIPSKEAEKVLKETKWLVTEGPSVSSKID